MFLQGLFIHKAAQFGFANIPITLQVFQMIENQQVDTKFNQSLCAWLLELARAESQLRQCLLQNPNLVANNFSDYIGAHQHLNRYLTNHGLEEVPNFSQALISDIEQQLSQLNSANNHHSQPLAQKTV